MAGQEIGTYYVSLMPSGRGFEKAAQGQAESAFKGAEKSSNGFFSGLAKWAKRGGLAVGGIVATVGALAVGGGISRALNIEDATAKLKGLGHDTKAVDQIMRDALASVKGTAFGLDAAATSAASAVAAGIKPGKELERYLRLTADAATIAGVSLEEMGSIINKATAKGKVGMDDLNRLTERGIPILQMLAKEYGVSAEEMSKMVSNGEVDAARFRKALEDNVGGAALESGNTTRGAFANMRAALSRLGLAFVGDGLSGAKTFFNEVTKILDGLTERIGPWVEKIQDKLKGTFKIEGMGDTFLGALDNFLKNFDSTPLGLLLGALKPLIPVIREIGEKVGPVLAETLGEIWDAVEPLVPLITDSLVDAFVQLAPPLADLLIALLPLIPPLVQLAGELIPLLTEVIGWATPHIADMVEGIADVVEMFGDLQSVLEGDKSLEDFGRQMTEARGPVGDMSRALLDLFITASTKISEFVGFWRGKWIEVTTAFDRAGALLKSAAKTLWMMLPEEFRTGVEKAVNWVKTLPDKAKNALANAGERLVSSGKALIRGFIKGIKDMFPALGSTIDGLMSFAKGFFPHSPAKWGPFSGAGWTQLGESGSAVMDEFMSGLDRDMPLVQARLNHSLSIPSGTLGGSSKPFSLDGMQIQGTLDLGNGLTGFVDGRIQARRASPQQVHARLPFTR